MRTRSEYPRNIVIYRTGQLGDTLVSLPAMRAVRDAYPNHTLILLTDQHPHKGLVSSWEILCSTALFSQVLFYIPPAGNFLGWQRLPRLVFQIRKLRPEAFFYLRDFPWNHVRRDRWFFRVLCGITKAYGLEQGDYIFGHRDAGGHLIRFPPEVDRLLEIVGRAGIAIPSPGQANPAVMLSANERSRIDLLWKDEGIPNDAVVIGLGPGSKMPAKRWPLERFKEVGRNLLANFSRCWLMVFGGSEDHLIGEEICRALGNHVINVAGRLSVLESAEALRRCSLYVGNDTGVMHLAAAVGTPCVGIFSARDHPGRWEPYGRGHVVLRKEPSCAGCLLQVCEKHDMRCLQEIQVDEVVGAIRCILQEKCWSAGVS